MVKKPICEKIYFAEMKDKNMIETRKSVRIYFNFIVGKFYF